MDISHLTTAEKWDYIYSSLGIKDLMDFLASSQLQYELLPLKIFFIMFTLLFFALVMYLYTHSSYIKYHYMQNVSEILSGQAGGSGDIGIRWKKLIKRTESGNEKDFKLAIVEADEFLHQMLEERGYEGGSFEAMVKSVGTKIMPNVQEVLNAHEVRNSIVYDLNYKLDIEKAKKILDEYEKTIENLAV